MAFFALPSFTATRIQVATYLCFIALFSISFLVFLNSSISFVVTDRIGQQDGVGDAVGTLGFADELVALVACPVWGILSDRIGVRSVAVMGYMLVGVALVLIVCTHNVYPELLLARLFFSLGGAATSTMVTAILPSMTHQTPVFPQPNAQAQRANGSARHTPSPSVSSELTITPDRFRTNSQNARPQAADAATTRANETEKQIPRQSATSQLAGLVGMFTGLGALLALGVFLPLPKSFRDDGKSASEAIADSFYIVGAIAIGVAIVCFFGLRNLPGESHKSWRNLFTVKTDKSDLEYEPASRKARTYARLLADSIALGFQDLDIGIGYLGGFVARASSVAISLFIPLYVNAYFISSGRCPSDREPANGVGDLKSSCSDAYILASILTGVSQLVALLCAPLMGYLSGRCASFNWPLLASALLGMVGYIAFGVLSSPDPKSEEGNAGVFIIVALLGISQIGAIVCSLALLGRGIQSTTASASSETSEWYRSNGSTTSGAQPEAEHVAYSRGSTPTTEAPLRDPFADPEPVHEGAPLLPSTLPSHLRGSPNDREDRAYLRGSIAGVYSLAGGAGILLLTKLGGALFDKNTGTPFWLMAGFNGLLAVVMSAAGAASFMRSGSRKEQVE